MSSVDRLYREASEIVGALEQRELSLSVAAGDSLRKGLLLAAASYFEHRLSTTVLDFVRERAPGDARVIELVRNKAVLRQYHTWFTWTDANANTFFAMFGATFKAHMAAKVKADEALSKSIRAFLDLGNERNRLVHGDFASFSLNKTLDEIYGQYILGRMFVEGIEAFLREVAPGEPA